MLLYADLPQHATVAKQINVNDSTAQTAAHARACLDRAAPSLWPRVAAKLNVRGPEHKPVVFAQSRGFVRRGGGRHLPVPLPGMTRRMVDSCTGPAFIIACCISRYLWCLCVAGRRCTPGSLLLSLGSGRKRVCAGGGHFFCFWALLEGSVQTSCSLTLLWGWARGVLGPWRIAKLLPSPFPFF